MLDKLKIGSCYKIESTVSLYDKSFRLPIRVRPRISFIVLEQLWVYELAGWCYKILYDSKIYYISNNWDAFAIELNSVE